MVDALELRQPRDKVPHFEMQFQLCEEAFGRDFPEEEDIAKARGTERERLVAQAADMSLLVAETFGWSALAIWRPYAGEAYLETVRLLRKQTGDRYMIMAFAGNGTLGIPDGQSMEELAVKLYERPQDMHAECHRMLAEAIEWGKRAYDAGAELLILNTDYALNKGPFLSPKLFAEFVTPYLQENVRALREYGAYVMLHTDGQIMPIMDQLLSSEPHALQSIDPMAGMDIAEVKRLYGDRLCLMGNVNCAMLQDATPEQVREESRRCIEAAKPGGGYIFSSSNVIFKGMPLDNYWAMLDALKSYGRYSDSD